MSVDKHSADGAHTQDCVTQQEVSLLPLAAFSMYDCTLIITRANSDAYFSHFGFLYPLDAFAKQTK